eukprot:scaffold150139_cov23-Tisochrysis_lutea.AAC.1
MSHKGQSTLLPHHVTHCCLVTSHMTSHRGQSTLLPHSVACGKAHSWQLHGIFVSSARPASQHQLLIVPFPLINPLCQRCATLASAVSSS